MIRILMPRRFLLILPLALALPLTLFALTATFIPINVGPYPAGYRDRSVATFFVRSYNHFLEFYFLTHPNTPRSPLTGPAFHDAGQDIEFNAVTWFRGFSYVHQDYVNNTTNLVTIRGHDITISAWLLALVSTPITFLLAYPLLRPLFRKKPSDANARPCPNCHYDLRASTTTCPECGTPIPQRQP